MSLLAQVGPRSPSHPRSLFLTYIGLYFLLGPRKTSCLSIPSYLQGSIHRASYLGTYLELGTDWTTGLTAPISMLNVKVVAGFFQTFCGVLGSERWISSSSNPANPGRYLPTYQQNFLFVTYLPKCQVLRYLLNC